MSQTLVQRYNKLPDVDTAHENFLSQLSAAFPGDTTVEALRKLLVELANDWPSSTYTKVPLFGVWLIHRHYRLKDGEKMVFTRSKLVDENQDEGLNRKGQRLDGVIYGIMEPKGELIENLSLANVMKWDKDGKELEHMHMARPVAVGEGVWEFAEVSAHFDAVQEHFDEVMKAHNITALGLCLGPTRSSVRYLQDGYVIQETTNQSELLLDRKHILNLDSNPPEDQIETAWIPLPSIWDQSRDSPEDRASPLHWRKLLNLPDTHPLRVSGCNHPCNPGDHIRVQSDSG